jgi:hypothetical protein
MEIALLLCRHKLSGNEPEPGAILPERRSVKNKQNPNSHKSDDEQMN